jgi:hypothetical protein
MMMSGKQYSLDSRIDLVEAVQASQDEEDQENVTRTQDKEDTGMTISREKQRNVTLLSSQRGQVKLI